MMLINEAMMLHGLRQTMNETYIEDANIDAADETRLVELAGNMRRGLPIATPVFDGAHEHNIVEMLKQAGLDTSGQVLRMMAGQGEPFARPVTVGLHLYAQTASLGGR